jgi:hypothetical protein
MVPRAISFSAINSLILGLILLAQPMAVSAQRHGGGGTSTGQGGLDSFTRPDAVDDKDGLQDFHHTMAVQATSQQIAEFQALVKTIEKAKTEQQTFLQQVGKEKTGAGLSHTALDQALQNARSGSKKFVGGFSDIQKAGLREITKRLDKSDSDLEQEQTKLNQSLQSANPASSEVSERAESLGRALTEFSSQQLALGREMSIILANGQDLAFNLPAVKSPVNIEGHAIALTVSGVLSQIEEQNGQRTFKLQLNEDLSQLQQNIFMLLQAQLGNTNPCGEQLAVRQAMLTPAPPSSVLILRLHYERWSCARMFGQTSSNELAESDGTVEVKLTPAVEKSNTLKLAAEFGRIDASGIFADSLRSGDLGDDLRDKVSRSVLSVLRAGVDFKTTLPPALQNSALIQSAWFRDAGAGVLNVVLEGKTQISNEQVNLLASQLNQAMSAGTSASQ